MTAESGLYRLTASEIAPRIADGDLTSSAVTRAILARIAALDDRLHAWVHVDTARVLAEAEALDTDAAAGKLRGPLHGVPVGIKDIYDVVGIPTKAGSRSRLDAAPATVDSAPAARLRAAGALIVGKTATTEFAGPDPAETRNPWNLEHTPGGSSSGSAAAVAARVVPVALGSQTAGSVVRPASFCGIVGLKPTHGRINAAGVIPLAWSLDTMGILCRSVADAKLLLDVLTDPGFVPGAANAVSPRLTSPPRLGYLPRLFPDRLDPRMHEMLAKVALTLQRSGATVEEVTLPSDFATALDAQSLIMNVEAATYHRSDFARVPDLYGPMLRQRIEAGALVPAVSYLTAQRVRRDLLERTLPVIEHFDALLAPAAAGPAPLGLSTTGDPAFNAPWTLLGLPAITLCGGLDSDGLPLGLQLVGRVRADEALLDTAAWCEQILGSAPVPPEPSN